MEVRDGRHLVGSGGQSKSVVLLHLEVLPPAVTQLGRPGSRRVVEDAPTDGLVGVEQDLLGAPPCRTSQRLEDVGALTDLGADGLGVLGEGASIELIVVCNLEHVPETICIYMRVY